MRVAGQEHCTLPYVWPLPNSTAPAFVAMVMLSHVSACCQRRLKRPSPAWLPCRRNVGATAGPVLTPLAALRAALPGAEVTFNSDTAYRYTRANAAADAAACEVRLLWFLCSRGACDA